MHEFSQACHRCGACLGEPGSATAAYGSEECAVCLPGETLFCSIGLNPHRRLRRAPLPLITCPVFVSPVLGLCGVILTCPTVCFVTFLVRTRANDQTFQARCRVSRAIGTHSPTEGAVNCTRCDPGYFQDQKSQSSCLVCILFFFF